MSNENTWDARTQKTKTMSKQVVIEKAEDPLMWYADKIGQTIPVKHEDKQYYWAREDTGYINIIHKDDAREI